jgi:hypothetical protein
MGIDVPKYRILPAAAANGILTALDAPRRASRTRGIPGAAIALLSPETWSGVGDPPISWTLPSGALYEAGGSRVAIVGTDAFAAGRPEFSGALDALPADWSNDV